MAKIADVQEVSLEKLRPYERNAKKHGAGQIEKLKSSIMEFGFLTPCMIDSDYNLIAGHGRVMAAKELGIETVPCVFIEGLTDEQRRAYILADNRLGELGEWDMELVVGELIELDELGFDVELTGFDMPEELPEVIEDDFDESAIPDEPRTKMGDLWQLGEHRLICGDSTDVNVVERLMRGQKADIAITSPPYGAGNSSKIRNHYVKGADTPDSFYNEHDDNISEWDDLIRGSFNAMASVSDAQFINIQMLADNKRQLMRFVADNAENLIDVIIWDKKKAPPQMQSNVLNNQFEFVFIFGGQSRSIPYANFHGNINNIIALTTGVNEYADVHRAVFPIAFPAELLKIASEAKSVIDVFGGTGTTLIACEQFDRICYMCELDPKYCDIIIDRWEQFTGREAVLING